MWACVCGCGCSWRPEEDAGFPAGGVTGRYYEFENWSSIEPGNQDAINVGFPGVEVIGGCELHHVGARNHTDPLEEQQVLLTDLPPAPQFIYCVGVGCECDGACPGIQEITSGSWISLSPSFTSVVEIELWSSDLAASTFTHQVMWLAP